MTGFDSKRKVAQAKLDDDDTQVYADTLLIVYQRGFADGKEAAQQQAEPVAWAVDGITQMFRGEFAELDAKSKARRIGGTCVAYPLYTTPPKRQWQGLTDEEKKTLATAAGCTEDDDGHIVTEIFRLAEAKLKEKNT